MGKIRLLISDDVQPARRGLCALLSFTPEIEIIGEAANGAEAVQLVDTTHPDVVLMDIQMPVMDGLQATKLIKKRWPQIKVIGLSTYPIYRNRAIEAGADGFLIKGCSADDLRSAILEPAIPKTGNFAPNTTES